MQDGEYMDNKKIIFKKILCEYFKEDNIEILDNIILDSFLGYLDLDDNFEIVGQGTYSKVYKIKDKVLKIGLAKINLDIINHPRIIKTYIKCNLPLMVNNSRFNLGVEIQDYASKTNISEEDMFKIYYELRNDNIIWKDIKESNVCKKDDTYCVVDTDYIGDVNKVLNFKDDVETKFSIIYTDNRR